MTSHVFALCAELSKFLQNHNDWDLKHFEGSSFLLTLTYLVNIFGALYHLKAFVGLERCFDYYFFD